MLLRHTRQSGVECLTQQHHAHLSGMLAQAWAQCHLHPLVVAAIGRHDDPWREADADPTYNTETGLPHDFLDYPLDDKLAMYRTGIDALERVDPYLAYMVSLHYTTFAGTEDLERLQTPERRRRQRLEARLDARLVSGAETALAWVKFFDVLSLYLCLTGPDASPASIPSWLEETSAWSTAPDETTIALEWSDERSLAIAPWPFDKAVLSFDLHLRRLPGPTSSREAFAEAWRTAEPDRRRVELTPG